MTKCHVWSVVYLSGRSWNWTRHFGCTRTRPTLFLLVRLMFQSQDSWFLSFSAQLELYRWWLLTLIQAAPNWIHHHYIETWFPKEDCLLSLLWLLTSVGHLHKSFPSELTSLLGRTFLHCHLRFFEERNWHNLAKKLHLEDGRSICIPWVQSSNLHLSTIEIWGSLVDHLVLWLYKTSFQYHQRIPPALSWI